jgi:hypothetical protein
MHIIKEDGAERRIGFSVATLGPKFNKSFLADMIIPAMFALIDI